MPYVFGYGSLVDRESLEATLGRPVPASTGPYPARLRGFRRRWNVIVHSGSRSDYSLTDAAGDPWTGWIVFLGLEPATPAHALGALYRLEPSDFVGLDLRERSYDRVEVTESIEHDADIPAGETIFTYVTKLDVRAGAGELGSGGIIMARYLRLIDRAYRALGDDLYTEHLATLPSHDPFIVNEITATPTSRHARNEAVDPLRG